MCAQAKKTAESTAEGGELAALAAEVFQAKLGKADGQEFSGTTPVYICVCDTLFATGIVHVCSFAYQ